MQRSPAIAETEAEKQQHLRMEPAGLKPPSPHLCLKLAVLNSLRARLLQPTLAPAMLVMSSHCRWAKRQRLQEAKKHLVARRNQLQAQPDGQIALSVLSVGPALRSRP
jgi:hypothetical protein